MLLLALLDIVLLVLATQCRHGSAEFCEQDVISELLRGTGVGAHRPTSVDPVQSKVADLKDADAKVTALLADAPRWKADGSRQLTEAFVATSSHGLVIAKRLQSVSDVMASRLRASGSSGYVFAITLLAFAVVITCLAYILGTMPSSTLERRSVRPPAARASLSNMIQPGGKYSRSDTRDSRAASSGNRGSIQNFPLPQATGTGNSQLVLAHHQHMQEYVATMMPPPRQPQMVLVPDMVVPESCECLISVPIRCRSKESVPGQAVQYDVTDGEGQVLLNLVVDRSPGTVGTPMYGEDKDVERVELRDTQACVCHGFLDIEWPRRDGARPEVTISSGDRLQVLIGEEGTNSKGNRVLMFRPSRAASPIMVLQEHNHQHSNQGHRHITISAPGQFYAAQAEPGESKTTSEYCHWVYMEPRVDAGLLILALTAFGRVSNSVGRDDRPKLSDSSSAPTLSGRDDRRKFPDSSSRSAPTFVGRDDRPS